MITTTTEGSKIMNILLIKAKQKDKDFLLKLRKATMTAHLENANLFFTDEDHKIAIDESFENAYLIHDYLQPIGLLKYKETANTFGILQFQILPEFQNKGIGNYIIELMHNICKIKNKTLSLKVLKNNPASHLYSRNGFKIVAQDKREYLMQMLPKK